MPHPRHINDSYDSYVFVDDKYNVLSQNGFISFIHSSFKIQSNCRNNLWVKPIQLCQKYDKTGRYAGFIMVAEILDHLVTFRVRFHFIGLLR